jgi:hypothetical protein
MWMQKCRWRREWRRSWRDQMALIKSQQNVRIVSRPEPEQASEAGRYINFALFVGASIVLLTAGSLSDRVSMKATIKNKGIRGPEMRLPTMTPFVCATLVGGVVVAVGYQQRWSWEVVLITGYTLLGLQLASVAAIATTYAVGSPFSMLF